MRLQVGPLGFLVAIALTLGLGTASAETTVDVVRKTLPAHPGGRLIIDTDRGGITVSPGSEGEVSVEVTRKVSRGSEQKAAELMDRHRVEFVDEAGTLKLTASLQGKDKWSLRGPQLEVEIRVVVPRQFHLDARTAGGSVRVGGLKGDVAARTAGGSLHFEDLSGNLNGRTSGGSIHGMKLDGRVDLNTSGGSVELDGVTQGPVKVGSSGGSLRLNGIAATLEARTSGGSIRIEGSGAPIVASTSGGSVDVTLTGAPTGTIELRSSAGGVSLALPEKAGFQLDASTSAGGVRSDFPVSVSDSGDRSSLKGPVNGGGPLLKLRTSAGSVRIKKT